MNALKIKKELINQKNQILKAIFITLLKYLFHITQIKLKATDLLKNKPKQYLIQEVLFQKVMI